MSNPNKAYFDKYIDPVVREIDRVNIYEFERGMDYELIQEGGIVDPETIKKAQGKVLKNLKKDPAYYTNQLVSDSVKLVGEYGSGKKPGKRNTPQDAEKVKKDGKMPKANKQDAPFGEKKEVKGKYKSSGMEPAKKDKQYSHTKGSLKEGMDYDISNQDTSDDPAAYGHGTMRSFENTEDKDLEMIRNAMKRDVRGTKKPAAPAPKNEDDFRSFKKSPEWQRMANRSRDVLGMRNPGDVAREKEMYRDVINKKGIGKYYANVGPKGPLPEMINVRDSRKFYITRESADMLKKMVSEAIAMVTTRGGTKAVDYKNDSELADLRADSNVTSIEKSSGQKVK
jgi:hypothetical protein